MLPRDRHACGRAADRVTTGYGDVRVSFAQQGPPASAKQIAYIQALMRKAGYDDFRSARTEYRLTQRQARGKFTKSRGVGVDRSADLGRRRQPHRLGQSRSPTRFESAQSLLVRGFPADVLADELRRRGWTVGEPSGTRAQSWQRGTNTPLAGEAPSIASAARMTAAPVYADTSSTGKRISAG